MADRHLDNGRELPVLLVLEADIAGIDAVFRESLGAGGVIGEQFVADIVEIAHQRHIDAAFREAIADMRHGSGGFIPIHRDATISEPARAKAATCAMVPAISAVSVFVMDCTTIGAPPPTVTCPTLTGTVTCGNAAHAAGRSAQRRYS